jgi:hypothetical protein
MFYLTINGTYNDGDIPVYNNGTLETCEPSEIVEYNEFNCTQYALLTARNPLACQAYISIDNSWRLASDNAVSRAAIVSFGPDAGCIVLASGNGYNYTGHLCATNALKSANFSGVASTCHTVGCDLSILVIGQTVTGCTGIPNTACNPNVNTNIVNKLPSTFTAGVPLNPTSYGLFLNKKAGALASQVLDFIVSVPEKTKIELQLLVDLNGVTSSNWADFKKGITSIHNLLTAEGLLPSVGLSTIDSNGGLTIRPITPNADTLLGQYNAVSVTGSSAATSKIWANFATLANSAASGWSKGSAHRFVVIISTKPQNGDLSTAHSAHINKMIAPIVLNTDLTSYSLSGFKFSDSNQLPSDWAPSWATRLVPVALGLARQLVFTPVNDIHATNGFVTNLPATATPAASSQVATSFTVRYPTASTSGITFPYALKVLVWGYDVITVNVIINHDPVVLPPLTFGANWNESSAFAISTSDEDGNTLFVTYTGIFPAAAKTAGVIRNRQNVPLVTPSNATDFSGFFVPNGWASGRINVTGTVSDGCSTTPFTLTFIAGTKPNAPPNSANNQVTTPEDTPIAINIPRLGDQEDAEADLIAQIVAISGVGTFYTDATMTTPLAGSMFLRTIASRNGLYYVPPANTASVGNTPLAYFTFIAYDTEGVPSPVYTVSVIVTPVNDPPTYTGETVITIDEDTRAEIGLRDYLEDVDTGAELIKVIIGKNVQRGNLYECISTDTGCNLKEITTIPYELDLENNPSGRVIFVPLPDENGDNYANFNLVADDRTNQSVFTITINVRPVNDPPVITPFFSVLPLWNKMDEDTEFVLFWNVTDIDSPLDSLTVDSRAIPQNFAGKLYQYVPSGGDYTRGEELSGSGLIPRVSPGVWAVIVVPNANIYDNTFLRLRLTAYDDYQAPSLPVNAPISVLPINDAPVISATEQTLTRTDNLQITLGFIAVSDIDAGRKNVDVSFTVQDASVGHFGFDALTSREEKSNPCTMNADNTSVICTDDLVSLNEKWFKVIIYYPGTTGSQVITVFADDLGHTDKWDRPLNDTKLIIVNIGEDTGLLETPGEDNTLTIAVAVSVAGAVAAVALVLFLIRDKLAGQTDAYFESLTEPLSTGGVNPVYQQAGSSGQNPTYVPRV